MSWRSSGGKSFSPMRFLWGYRGPCSGNLSCLEAFFMQRLVVRLILEKKAGNVIRTRTWGVVSPYVKAFETCCQVAFVVACKKACAVNSSQQILLHRADFTEGVRDSALLWIIFRTRGVIARLVFCMFV